MEKDKAKKQSGQVRQKGDSHPGANPPRDQAKKISHDADDSDTEKNQQEKQRGPGKERGK